LVSVFTLSRSRYFVVVEVDLFEYFSLIFYIVVILDIFISPGISSTLSSIEYLSAFSLQEHEVKNFWAYEMT